MAKACDRGFHWTIDKLRGGPPWGPMRLPMIVRADLSEWFVHHEDVRRANGRRPRADLADVDESLWALLRTGGRFMARRIRGVGLELRRTDGDGDGDSITLRTGEPLVRMVGRPSEMTLFLTGRADHAEVELVGDAEAVAAVRSTPLGV
jgi:uncharacterized protein (TIGR03085 family)